MDVFWNWLFGFSRIALLGILLALGFDLTSRFAMEENNINWGTFSVFGFACVITWLLFSGLIYYKSLRRKNILTFERNDRQTISYSPSDARSNFVDNIKYFLVVNIIITFLLVSGLYADKSISYSILKTIIDWVVS